MDFKLRPWQLSDLSDLVHFADNPNIAQYMSDVFVHPYSREAGEKFINWSTVNCPSKMMAITVDDRAVGGIGIHPQTDIFRKNAEIGYWLGEPFWGKGIVTEAVKQMVPIGFETYDIDRIFGRVFGHNAASARVLERAGFVLEGRFEKTLFKNDVAVDELIYAVRRPKTV